MAYNQNKNPFQSKSPLNHNLRDKRTGANYNHFHDPQNQGNIYSSDQKVISGSNKFGGNKANRRFYDEKLDERVSEADLAREYAGQIASMYNTGELISGNFLADDLYNKKRKLSIKNGKLQLKKGKMGIGAGKQFNQKYADEVEGYDPNVGYVAPETQYTEDQIYDMMVQGGGLVSIVDGQIVAGNPNQAMSEGYDQANRIRVNDDFRNQYEEGTEEEFNIRAERNNRPDLTQLQRDELQEKKNAILARREQKEADLIASRQAKKIAAQEKINEILARRKAEQGNSPVNNNSPLHQEQEIDPRTGEAIPGYDYVPGEEVITNRSEEVLDDNGNVIGYNDITDTTITNTGTMTPPSPPSPPPNDRPSFKEDCEGIVMNMGNSSKSGFYKCDIDPSPPNPNPSPSIETPEDLTHSYDDLTTSTVFRPIEQNPPEPIPQETTSRFNLRSASKKKGGLTIDWDLSLPQFGPKFNKWVSDLTKSGKKCGNCDYLRR